MFTLFTEHGPTGFSEDQELHAGSDTPAGPQDLSRSGAPLAGGRWWRPGGARCYHEARSSGVMRCSSLAYVLISGRSFMIQLKHNGLVSQRPDEVKTMM